MEACLRIVLSFLHPAQKVDPLGFFSHSPKAIICFLWVVAVRRFLTKAGFQFCHHCHDIWDADILTAPSLYVSDALQERSCVFMFTGRRNADFDDKSRKCDNLTHQVCNKVGCY